MLRIIAFASSTLVHTANLMKKLADTLDKNGTPTNKGDYVFFDLYKPGNFKHVILGKIIRINGEYIIVRQVDEKRKTWELYSTEITRATKEEATLWMLEN